MISKLNLFRNIYRPFVESTRGVRKWKFEGGIQYYGFKYFPRTPDFKDPPYEPSKLFLIRRTAKMLGTTKWEKRDLGLLNIDGHIKKQGHISIVKNTPEVNYVLYRVKHLIEILPINFINGLPQDGDFNGCFLKDNGDFLVSHKLKVSQEQEEGIVNMHKDKRIIDRQTIRKFLRDKWENPLDGGVN